MSEDGFQHLTGEVPEHVIMLLLGESKRYYADGQSVHHDRLFPADSEVWTCNAGMRIWRHDLLFVMDDLELEAYRWPLYGKDLELHDRPIITSKAYPRWPMARDYPFDEVCERLNLSGMTRYFFNTVPYMIAYAIYIGAKHITLFGADYYHPDQPGMREADLANTEWWLGFAAARGVEISLSPNTTLMGANEPKRPLYGYRFDPRIQQERDAALLDIAHHPPSTNSPRTTSGGNEAKPASQSLESLISRF